ncbi:DeoR/GlpR family DNA-binding transcription regulator [Gelidibacter japonicus]|uniref:DeoR/GlpR family DNA-binding transcription regulator n=1 Tax=Gelidibacter japonicus TaxID=1962232 RepID=UPI0020209559|nr:DeoR/GlpR family DNA-binding transcription regulator [Gelidibacter japonicus]MCL8006846.1 DeoR/GlpR family DNA-binding transcription regulator [Gelidibacter japonicus]
MKKNERQRLIVDKVMLHRKVLSDQLALELNVSDDTIRRDLNELDEKGLLTKVHGGAVSSIQKLFYYNENAVFNREEKKIIAAKAIPLLEGGMVAILSGGTTNLVFVSALPKSLKATIYTYSLEIALQLTDHPHIETIFIGGKIQKKSMVTIGIDVFQILSKIHADICFVGASGITLNKGITDEGYEIALIKKAMIDSSDKTVSLITSNKLNIRHNYSVCPLSEIDVIVSDLDRDDKLLKAYAQQDILIL